MDIPFVIYFKLTVSALFSSDNFLQDTKGTSNRVEDEVCCTYKSYKVDTDSVGLV